MKFSFTGLLIFFFLCSGLISIDNLSVKQEKSFARAKVLTENGKKAFEKRDFKEAESFFKKAVNKFPYIHEAYYYISKIHYFDKRYHSAVHFADKSIEYYYKINNYIIAKKKDRVIKLKSRYREISEAEKQIPDDVPGCKGSAYASAKAKMQADLELLGDKIQRLSSSSDNKKVIALYLFHKGNVLFRMNRMGEAGKEYEESVKVKPGFRDSWINLIVVNMITRGKAEAIEVMKRAEKHRIKIDNRLKRKLL